MFTRSLVVLAWSIAASLSTAFAFAISTSGKISFSTLTLPGVAVIAAMFGGFASVVLWPYMYWCLKDRQIAFPVVILVVLSILVVSCCTLVSPRVGLVSAVVYWIISLMVVRICFS